MTQPSFFDDDRDDDELTPRERFERFHARHPEVYRELKELCITWRSRGRHRWSIDAAMHVLRFQRRMAGLPDESEAYKLNNNYTSRYARLLVERNPELDGLFEMRRMRDEG